MPPIVAEKGNRWQVEGGRRKEDGEFGGGSGVGEGFLGGKFRWVPEVGSGFFRFRKIFSAGFWFYVNLVEM
jgi:hypothetical protein